MHFVGPVGQAKGPGALCHRPERKIARHASRSPDLNRSIDDALFVEAGHAARAREDARRWGVDLQRDPKLLFDGGTAAFGMRLALDSATASIILGAVAAIDTQDENGELASDFLDDLARRGDPAGRLTILSRDLRDLKKARSKQLAVVLALDGITSSNCEGARHLLGRLRDEGDSRALLGIERLGKATGCGRKANADCFPCLRDRDAAKLLSGATEACRSRAFKPPWRIKGDGS